MQSQETALSATFSEPKPERSLLPVLTVLFVISYGLMVMLIIEQGNTITSQRWLIKQLFSDSSELSALKTKAIQEKKAGAQAQTRSKTPSPAPSGQAPAQEGSKPSVNANKARKVSPQHPSKPASDTTDVRRSLVSI